MIGVCGWCSNAEVDLAGRRLVGDIDTDQADSAQVVARHQTAEVSTELAGRQLCGTVLLDSNGSLSTCPLHAGFHSALIRSDENL